MADIAPFRGLRYNLPRTGSAADLLAPPYDVISDAGRDALERRHARNVVRLDLPRGQGDARYDGARQLLAAWTAEGTLVRDERPAIFRYRQSFRWPLDGGGSEYVRRGFIALVRLEPFAARVVLPHEHTLSAPKQDRLKLMRATRAQFSQVFVLYRDPRGEAEEVLAGVERDPPALEASVDGCRHELWPVPDPERIARVAAVLRGKQVMIADGHHRYETMIALRDELRPAGLPPGQSGADWGSVFFARAEDPGLLVLPTHRLVKGLPAFDVRALRDKARAHFDVAEGTEATAPALEQRLGVEGARRPVLAVRAAGRAETTWLALRPEADLTALGPPSLQRLDVTILHGLVLGPLLGIDREAMARQAYLSYTHDTGEALARVSAGDVQAGFFMNATKVGQVLDACEAGFVLPQKSTYFQPKLATGLAMYEIDPSAGPALPGEIS